MIRLDGVYLERAGRPVLDGVALCVNPGELAVRGADLETAQAAGVKALELLGIGGCAEQPVTALSAGERQLVAVARALAGPPAVAVLDEPAAGLGDDDRERLLATLVAAQND